MQAPKPDPTVLGAAVTDQNVATTDSRPGIVSRFNHFLSTMAALDPTADLFVSAAQALMKLLDVRFVGINLYHPAEETVICRAFAAPSDVETYLTSLFGRPPIGYIVSVKPGAVQQSLQDGRLHHLASGLYELLAETFSLEICVQAERILGIESCCAVGMTWQGAVLGTMALGTAAGVVVEADLVEACAQQIAVLHRQREIEQQLLDARTRLEERVFHRTEQLERSNRALRAEIYERRQVEAALRASQANLQAIFENAEDSIWSVDRSYRLLVGNHVFQRNTAAAFGRPVAPGESVLDQDISSEAYAKWKGHYDRALAGEHFVLEEPGQLLLSRVMEYRFGPIRTDDGSVVGVTVINRDVTQQWQTREELRKGEEKYRRLFDNAQIGIFRTRLDGSEVLEINERLAQILMKAKSAVEGRSTLLNWAVPDERREFLQALSRTGRIDAFEMRVSVQDGLEHTLLVSATAYPEENLLEGTATDITERKAMEQALRESERRMADLLHNLPGMAYRCRNDRNYTMEFLSEGVQALTGYSADDIVDNRRIAFVELIEPEDRALVWDAVQAGVAQHRSFRMSYRIRTAAGQQKWVWEQGQAVYARDGKVAALEGFITDITELKAAQDVIQESELRFRSLFEVSGIGTAIVGVDGQIVRANRSLGAFLECPPARLVGKTIADVTYPDDLDADEQSIEKLVAGEIMSYSLEKRYVTASGKVVWGLLTASLVRDRRGTPLFLIGQVQDIDARKAVEAELARLYQQTQQDAQDKGILLNEVNHRVKNNLMAILGLLLAEQQFAPPDQRVQIESYFENIARRIRGLIEVHRLLSDSEWAPLQLGELCSRVIHAELNALSLSERVQVEVTPANILVNSRQASNLATVVNELLANSIKHALNSVATLEIALALSMIDGHIQIDYRDNGSGYPTAVLYGEQHGVGLYLMRRIVERTLRGSLSIANDAGAVTQINIPCESMEQAHLGG